MEPHIELPPQQARVAQEKAAEIAFLAGVNEFEEASLFGQEQPALTLESVVDSCMGLVDSGATASLGWTDALEKVRVANLQNHGETMSAGSQCSDLAMEPSQNACPQ